MAWAGPSHDFWLWLGPALEKAKAGSGQAKASGFWAKPGRNITRRNCRCDGLLHDEDEREGNLNLDFLDLQLLSS
jgi:hypothetical protein